MSQPEQAPPLDPVINVDDAPEIAQLKGDGWGGHFKRLTPSMAPGGGSLGVNWMRVPKGRSICPFHTHQIDAVGTIDEVFFVLSGRGVLRYGEDLVAIKAGDCVSCPAGTGKGHQIANPHDEDLIYLAIGHRDPNEVCTYPDTGKVLIRSLGQIGQLDPRGYMDGEPDQPRIFNLISEEPS